MFRFGKILFAVMLCIGVFGVLSSFAQSNTGRITGTITDVTGAVIPGVEVTVTNPATGLSRNTISNESGTYQVPLLPPAAYNVQVALAGFATQVRGGITLQVDQVLRIDFALKVGAASERIEVTADAPLLQNETAELGQVIDSQKMTDIPLNQRHFMSLTLLTAGVLPDVQGGSTQSPSFYANGIGRNQNNFLFDGVDNNDTGNSQLNIIPSVDAIEEFKLSTSAYGADLGRASGGVLNVQTKSGTNAFHVVVFEFLRNNALDARNPFATVIQPYKRNQFGTVLSGPVKKDKIFFMFNYEGNRIRETDTSLTHVPSLLERAGNFSETSKPLIDPLTGQAFPGNIIPTNRINPLSLAISQGTPAGYPLPNRPLIGGANYEANAPEITNSDLYTGRVDIKVSDEQSIFGRLTWQDTYQIQNNFANSTYGGSATIPHQGNTFFQPYGRNVALQDTYIFGPRMVNEARIGFNRLDGGIFDETCCTSTDWAKQIGVTGVQSSYFPNSVRFGWPRMSVTGYSGIGTTGFSAQQRYDNTWHLYEALALTRGNHQLKIGAELLTYWINIFIDSSPNGNFSFDGRYSGQAFADVLLGYASSTSRKVGDVYTHNRSKSPAAFFQDDWKVSPQLTLNLGVRWEAQTRAINVLRGNGANFAVFDPATAQIMISGRTGPQKFSSPIPGVAVPVGAPGYTDPNTITLLGGVPFNHPDGLYYNDWRDFLPRFGFAYSPKSTRAVIRGGFGMFLATDIAANNHGNRDGAWPWSLPQSFTAAPAGQLPNVLMSDPFPAALGSNSITTSASDPYQRDGYVMQWNLTTQIPAGQNMSVEIAYVGTKGTKLSSSRPINQPVLGSGPIVSRRPYQAFSNISQNERAGLSAYHSFQAKLQRRFSGGLTFISSYTLSHSIACCSGFLDPANQRAGRATSSFDIRHRQVNSMSYELPFGANHRFLGGVSGVAGKLVSGWQMAGIATFTTGQKFTPSISGDIANIGSSSSRPNRIADGNLPRSERSAAKWFDTSAFVASPAGTFGNSGQSVLTAPGLNNWDFTLTKVTRIAENKRVEFRAEMFNAFNQTHFTIPNSTVNSPQFGHVTSANPARQIQFGLKVYY